jgi:hypothetical protein
MFRSISLALLLTFSMLCTALAAGGAHHHEGKHGGMMGDTNGHHHVELITEGQSMTLYVLHDDGELEDVTDAKATATVLSGGEMEKITLAPAGAALKGEGGVELGTGDTVVITLTMPGHKPEQARFTLD